MMTLLALLVSLSQAVLVQSLVQKSGYLGETITLPSGAKPSWHLSKIEWSIFSNNTWIATYRNGRPSTERVPQYKGRLSLNITSGDLTIRNLTYNDAMEYTVDLLNSDNDNDIHQIKLTVKQPLQKPTVRTVSATPLHGGCAMTLLCSSLNDIVAFFCQSDRVSAKTIPIQEGVLLSTFINGTLDHVRFNCTSGGKTENAWTIFTAKCDDNNNNTIPTQVTPHPPTDPSPPPISPIRDRLALCLFFGSFLGVSLTMLLIHCFRGKMCSSKNCSRFKSQELETKNHL